MISGIGTILLGLPKGFNRLGQARVLTVNIFENFDNRWGYDTLNVPIWKHLDAKGNTLIRGVSPRLSEWWIHIYLEDCLDKIDCMEITKEYMESID